MRTKSIGVFVLICSFYVSKIAVAQQRTLDFYQAQAISNNPALKENLNQQRIALLQNDIVAAQYKKPQVNITADYLFAPYFFNNGHFISITQNPGKNAFGYDNAISNGGLYATQVNISTQLFSGVLVNTYSSQNLIQHNLFQNTNKQLVHFSEKTIADQYISVYQFQQQLKYLQKILDIVEDNKKIVESLVQKGLMQQNDYLLLEIEIRQAQFDSQQQRINLSNAFNLLNNYCNIRDTNVFELAPPDISEKPIPAKYNYQEKFELDSTNVIAQYTVFNLKYRPQLFAFGNAGLNSIYIPNIPHDFGVSAGLHLYVPIYDGGQKKIVNEQNKLTLESLKYYQNQNEIQLSNNLYWLSRQIINTRQSLPLFDSQLSTQETLLQIIKDKVVIGQVSVTDYLNALQNYATSNQNKIQSQTNLWLLINQYNFINW